MASKPYCQTGTNDSVADPADQPPAHHDIDVELPCIDGMVAGTLALMTGYAEHQRGQHDPSYRELMAKKIVSNLFFLATHPRVSVPMAVVMRDLQRHWHTLSAHTGSQPTPPPSTSAGAHAQPAASSPTAQRDCAAQSNAFWLPEHPSMH